MALVSQRSEFADGFNLNTVLRIRSRIRTGMCFGPHVSPNPDTGVRATGPTPDPSIIEQL
jgi:hypothetical protein